MYSELPTSGLPTKYPILRWSILRFTLETIRYSIELHWTNVHETRAINLQACAMHVLKDVQNTQAFEVCTCALIRCMLTTVHKYLTILCTNVRLSFYPQLSFHHFSLECTCMRVYPMLWGFLVLCNVMRICSIMQCKDCHHCAMWWGLP